MKAITQYINESWTDGKLDKSVKTAERKKVYNAIYKKIEKSVVTPSCKTAARALVI